MKVKNMLLPLECSEVERPAIDSAIETAEQYGATLHAISVVDWGLTGWDYQAGEHVVRELHDTKEKFLEDVGDKAEQAGVEFVHRVFEDRDVHEVILDYAEDHDIDLLVMATHGRSGVDRFLLGSTTERIIRSTTTPILVIPIGKRSG